MESIIMWEEKNTMSLYSLLLSYFNSKMFDFFFFYDKFGMHPITDEPRTSPSTLSPYFI